VLSTRVIASVLAVLLALAAAAHAAGIERASAELVAPDTYRIDLSVTTDDWPVAIYPSSRPDAIDTDAKPVAARMTTVRVKVPGRRVYFHLKPASGRTRVVATRHIALEGAANLRDLGGYRTSDGRSVKWGLVYRSDNLGELTTADYQIMNSLGIRHDLRPAHVCRTSHGADRLAGRAGAAVPRHAAGHSGDRRRAAGETRPDGQRRTRHRRTTAAAD
jgi:hypothetical protein